jgi:hypothetical protein
MWFFLAKGNATGVSYLPDTAQMIPDISHPGEKRKKYGFSTNF